MGTPSITSFPIVEAQFWPRFCNATLSRDVRYTAGADTLRFAEGAALSGLLVYAAVVPIDYDLGAGVIFALLLFALLGLNRLSFNFFHQVVWTLDLPNARGPEELYHV
jgi:hypothetical protein